MLLQETGLLFLYYTPSIIKYKRYKILFDYVEVIVTALVVFTTVNIYLYNFFTNFAW
jgi:hypothetical protein